ncbi:hypothetical protein G7068_12895 [Leucobacter viscericola]|uniref:Uncharacterized protein n=1 Tax=Leucobacter viscericola TaxID=2714935 RepID=A0A6G7XHF6_9MICO|nr:hypothetical protein [Leucobacter viscericola]QIK63995.1 hypothetical protein G7068_12895 [Leucobacter viscericola]
MNTEPQPANQVPDQEPTPTAPTEPLGQNQTYPSPTAPNPPISEPHKKTAVQQPRPRTGPIVWGALILAFCGYVAQRTLYPGLPDATTWITATVIGLGLLLLGVGTAVLLRNRRR